MQPFHNLLSNPARPRERVYMEDDDARARQGAQAWYGRRLPLPNHHFLTGADARLPPVTQYPHPITDDVFHGRWQHAQPAGLPATAMTARHYTQIPQAHAPPLAASNTHAMASSSASKLDDVQPQAFADPTRNPVIEQRRQPASSSIESSTPMREPVARVKRARSTQKITRNRKITSCLQCRERKQKCDRQRPICGNCAASNGHEATCTYVDTTEGVQEVLASEGQKDAKRVKKSPSSSSLSKPVAASPSPPEILAAAPPSSTLKARRISLIAATSKAGRDNTLDFDTRVRYARAAAIGTILFGQPPPSDGSTATYSPLAAVDSLKLPTSAEVGPILDTYRREVEWLCNVVIIDLNRARIESFLDWWHSNPQTLPADPPLIPLVLCVLALATQATRLRKHCTLSRARENAAKSKSASEEDLLERMRPDDESNRKQGRMQFERGPSPGNDYLANVSSEKELLETAGRCIDILQIICPSNWASAFSAPLDLVRASLLRGLWHLSELHLQFAGSCFATTIRLAHAAALNHDTTHWPSMGREEAQARRNIFWCCAMVERMHTNRVLQPSMIVPTSFDTMFPDNHDALMHLFRLGGLLDARTPDGRPKQTRAKPMTKSSFDFYTACFRLTSVLIRGQIGSRTQNKQVLSEEYDSWRRNLPETLRHTLDSSDALRATQEQSHGNDTMDEEDKRTRYLQNAFLQMVSLGATVQIHRPQVDETGHWRPPEGQAQRSLELCLDAAQRLIRVVHSVFTQDPGPPFCLFNHAIFFCFQAAIVIAIQSALCPSNRPDGASMPSFAAQARPSLDTAIYTLDLVANEVELRWVAEQAGRYAATLRDIDATYASQLRNRKGSESMAEGAGAGAGTLITSPVTGRNVQPEEQNVRRPAIGVQPLAIAEGDGSRQGGQGYPKGKTEDSSENTEASTPASSRKRSTILPPQDLFAFGKDSSISLATPRGGTSTDLNGALRNIFHDVPTTFGIDFDDLEMIGQGPSNQDSRPPPGYFADRPMSGIFSKMLPPSLGPLDQTSSHQPTTDAYNGSHVAGLDGAVASGNSDPVTSNGMPWQSGYVEQRLSTSTGMLDKPSSANDAVHRKSSISAFSPLTRWPPSPKTATTGFDTQGNGQNVIAGQEGSIATAASNAHAQSDAGGNYALTDIAPNSQPFVLPHAAAPAVETLGDTFALDWSEWERAAERLLYADRF